MKKSVPPVVLAIALVTATTASLAQEVPNPAHPFPDDPIATDGSSLRSIWPSYGPRGVAPRPPSAVELQALQPPLRRRAR